MAIKSVRDPIVGMEGWGRYLTTGTAHDALPFKEETEEARQVRNNLFLNTHNTTY